MIVESNKTIFAVLFVVLLILPVTARSQSFWNMEGGSVTSVAVDEDLPFWFHTNKFGIFDRASTNQLFYLELTKKFEGNRQFDYRFGTESIGRISANSQVFLKEIYGEIKYGIFRLLAGKKEWRDGIWESDLSLGSMVWSGNAGVMPRLTVSVPEFWNFPGTNGFVAFRGYLSHGWFEDERFVKDSFLHAKALYMRVFPEDLVFNGQIGVIHNVQWGGVSPRFGRLPSGFGDFLDVFRGVSTDNEDAPRGEVTNALGNTVGAYEARFDLNFDHFHMKAYRQFFIETSVSADVRSPWDGIWGVELDLRNFAGGRISRVLWEHVNTKQQNAKTGEEIGADQYYNNFIYRNGWTFNNRLIGFPLVQTGDVNGIEQVVNNIIVTQHVGVEGKIPLTFHQYPFKYRLLTTYSRNYGRTTNCPDEFCLPDNNPLRTPRLDQWYNRVNLEVQVNEIWRIWNSVGFDFGEMRDELGFEFGFAFRWN